MRLALAFVLLAVPVWAQPIVIPHDPHPVPDFCASGGAVTGSETISTPTTPPSNLCVRSGATLTVSSALTVTTLLVNEGGTLILNPGASITFTDTAPTDAGQYGTGLIVAGTLKMLGTEKTAFLRLAVEPTAGATTLTLEASPVGWAPGDRIVLPDSRHLRVVDQTGILPTVNQWEERTIASVSGNVVTLTAPLTHAHPGARDHAGVLEFLPHVGNLSRSITLRSPAGAVNRGHVLITGRAEADVRYVRFENLGRTTIDPLNTTTNVAGRYSLHAHHLMGPVETSGPQFSFVGNAIDGGSSAHRRKWGLAIHDSHYGLIQGNVLYNWAGAAVMFEDGSESFNVLDGNFALRSTGDGPRTAMGTEGSGFWFRGPNNYVRNNVAANLWSLTFPEAAYGFKYFQQFLGDIRVPNFKGADTMVAGQYTLVNGNKLPVLEFDNNEVYAAHQGLTYWWVNANAGHGYNPSPLESVFRDFRAWHFVYFAVYSYQGDRVTFDGLTVRQQYAPGTARNSMGLFQSDYPTRDFLIKNADIQGTHTGVSLSTDASGTLTVENSSFRNNTDISVSTLRSVNGGSNVGPRLVILRNNQHNQYQARPHAAIRKAWANAAYTSQQYNTTSLDTMSVYKFKGNPADNFRVYYDEQGTQNVAGGLAPCTTTRPEVTGPAYACPIPPEAVDCVQGAWQLQSTSAWVPDGCPITEQQSAEQTLWRPTLQEPAGTGAACGPSTQVVPIVQACVYVPPTFTCELTGAGVACVFSGWPPPSVGYTFSHVVP